MTTVAPGTPNGGRGNRLVVWDPLPQPCEYSSLSPVDFSRSS